MSDTRATREKAAQPEAVARRSESGKVLRARPAKGKIDHRAITREIIARFPKILAALAK
jgi:hypothetical protein